ncbi:rhodanese-like domain-containing protein [Stieleria sp. JC731]|uniref:rhodanese-like domain-containing protein n=1 Tax=Pirellulaceae TaxID=2691357 RepID=UPI001E614ACE|nr:rhodanese-like domain-containing protein [Stieleria sp. JC731]MCC9602997.1 rhodanese-like domain-containing protein [Stieleria sp. JC731]
MQTIDVQELAEKRKNEEIELVDVRTPVEYRTVHVEGAKNVPLDSLSPAEYMQSRNGSSGKPLYVICQSGGRSAKGVKKFADAGYDDVVSVDGGTKAWEQAGLPVVRGKKMMSLERQVRIAAGFLVLVGVILALTVHEYFIGLSAFVGAGLMFAGITDTCAMGMMIAKMPWNQCSTGECKA